MNKNHPSSRVFYTKIALFSLLFVLSCARTQHTTEVDVIIIGGSTGGTAAGIQAARMGARTLILEPTHWLGGMLTAAGVSAIDGNHNLPAGIWGEFRDSLEQHYGGPEALLTGWVSNTQFEPKVGANIFTQITQKIEALEVHLQTQFIGVEALEDGWLVSAQKGDSSFQIKTKILIDGTDMGDVAAQLGVSYDLGMDAGSESGESMAPKEANDLIQDLTYAAILQDYGAEANKTIAKPANYDPSIFYCACKKLCDDPNSDAHPCETMLTYAKLPGDKYMINWPIFGNDYYAPVVEMSATERAAAFEQAKQKTLQFIYYIQNDLGYKNLGLAEDEFPSADQLPLLPYFREGRRPHGLVRMNVNHILTPYELETPLYKTGIAVGDYPIDHHHKEVPDAPEIDFPPVPAFNIPLGTLIPKDVDRLIMADKAISVSNIVNGSSRLQPVVLQIGQAAGALAALAAQNQQLPSEVAVREVQKALLASNGYLVPSYDVNPDHPQFKAIQRVAASGILPGKGEPYLWANRTWYYPDSSLAVTEFITGLERSGLDFNRLDNSGEVTGGNLKMILPNLELPENWGEKVLSRAELATLIDTQLQPFERPIQIDGRFE